MDGSRHEGPAGGRRSSAGVGHGPFPYRSPANGECHEPGRPWLKRIGSTVLVAVLFAVGLGYWVWVAGAQERAIAALPAGERTRLFTRALEDLRLCHAEAQQEALKDFCESQARLVLAFPECTADCRALARLPWAGSRR